MKAVAERLIGLLYPERCGHCGGRVEPGGRFFCACCTGGAKQVGGSACTVCGIPFPDGTGGPHLCADCIRNAPAYVSAKAPYVFGGVVREAIHRFKYRGRMAMAGYLATTFEGRLNDWFPDVGVVAAVPLHGSRLRERGFNQSLLLASHAAGMLRAGLSVDALARTRNTRPQVDLKTEERLANVRGAFGVARPREFEGEKVLLVDDVFTTGATVNECAKEILKAGAESVHVLTVARAVPYGAS